MNVTAQTEPLMERMHATEGGYNLTRLGGLHVEVAPHGGGGKSSSSNGGSSSGDGTSKGVSSSNGQSGKHAASGGKAGAFEVVDTVYQYNHKLGCINLPLRLPGSSQEQRQQQGRRGPLRGWQKRQQGEGKANPAGEEEGFRSGWAGLRCPSSTNRDASVAATMAMSDCWCPCSCRRWWSRVQPGGYCGDPRSRPRLPRCHPATDACGAAGGARRQCQ